MPITIVLPPMLQAIAGDIDRYETSGETIGVCLQNLAGRYPRVGQKLFMGGKLVNGLNIFLNGQNVSKNVLGQPVRDGDVIHVSFIVLGG